MNTHWMATGICAEVLCLHIESLKKTKEHSKMQKYLNDKKCALAVMYTYWVSMFPIPEIHWHAPPGQTSLKCDQDFNYCLVCKEIITKLSQALSNTLS